MLLLFLNQWITDAFLKALCWTFIHSLWQGVVAAVIAGIIVICTCKTKASLRYNLLTSLFVLFLLCIGLSFFFQLLHFNRQRNYSSLETIRPINVISIPFPKNNSLVATERDSFITTLTNYCNEYASFIVLLWFLFFTVKCLQLFSGLYHIHCLRKSGTFPASEVLSDITKRLCKLLHLPKAVVLLESRLVNSPLTIGCLKMTILIPIGLFTYLPPEQVEAVLLHELAHIRRNDYLVNLLQSFAETIFFFNPAILWISNLIRREREACCDDIVLQHIPHKSNYLQALVSFQEYSLMHSGTAMALTGQREPLLNRIKRILTHENQKLNIMERTLLMLGIIALTSFGFISATKTPVTTRKASAYFSQPASAVVNRNSFSNSNVTDTIKPGDKEAHKQSEKSMADVQMEKQPDMETIHSEKPYQVINGISFVMSKGSWASIDQYTDIIYVDGKRMTPEEVNSTIKRSVIKAVGATDGEAAQKKYGVDQPVLEIYINTRPETDWMRLTLTKEKKALLHEQEANEALLKEQEQKNTEMKQLYNLQRQLVIQEKGLQEPEQMMPKQMEEEMVRKQKHEVAEQQLLFKEQEAREKEQNVMMNAVKPELLKDGLIQEGEHYELMINSREMFIDGKKQAASIHQKYIELISNKRNRAFGDKEQWSVKE